MPKNFAWIAAVIHKQVPVRVAVPIDFRVLVREAVSERLAGELGARGKKVQKNEQTMVEVSKEDIQGKLTPAPLSATAREILGFTANGYYTVDRTIDTRTRMETLLKPTGKPLMNPYDVFVPEAMRYEVRIETLEKLGFTVAGDDRITEIATSVRELAERRDQRQREDRRNTILYWSSSALALLASWAFAAYTGSLAES